MNGRKRTVQIKFRVTEEERAFIEQKMQLVPTRNMEAYLRKMAIDGYIIQIDHADIKAMTAEIQKIGVNVNQIAKRVNATGSVYQEDIEEFKEVLAEIWRLQRLSLLKAREKKPLTISKTRTRRTGKCWCPRSGAAMKRQILSSDLHCRKLLTEETTSHTI